MNVDDFFSEFLIPCDICGQFCDGLCEDMGPSIYDEVCPYCGSYECDGYCDCLD